MQQQNQMVEGHVEDIKEKSGKNGDEPWKRLAWKINGEWYSGFLNDGNRRFREGVNKDDYVKIEYREDKKGFFTIVKVISRYTPEEYQDMVEQKFKTRERENPEW